MNSGLSRLAEVKKDRLFQARGSEERRVIPGSREEEFRVILARGKRNSGLFWLAEGGFLGYSGHSWASWTSGLKPPLSSGVNDLIALFCTFCHSCHLWSLNKVTPEESGARALFMSEGDESAESDDSWVNSTRCPAVLLVAHAYQDPGSPAGSPECQKVTLFRDPSRRPGMSLSPLSDTFVTFAESPE